MVVSQNRGVHGCPKHFLFGSKNKAWGTRILRQSQREKHEKKTNNEKTKQKTEKKKHKAWGASLVQVCCKLAPLRCKFDASLMPVLSYFDASLILVWCHCGASFIS